MSELIISREYFLKTIKDLKQLFEEKRDYLSELDSEIGDGDHGLNLSIGFREVEKQIEKINNESEDIATILKKIGFILLGKVGGSSGPLYGSFFMKAGDKIKGKNKVTFNEFCEMIALGVAAIELRGKAVIGDKTMIDAFKPGVDILMAGLNENKDEIELFEELVEEMKKGAESTIPLIAKKGRAMRLGERAIGHKDPGAESACLIMEIFLKNLKEVA